MSPVLRRPLSLVITCSLAVFASVSHAKNTNIAAVSFSETPAPATADDMAKTYTTSVATVTYVDGTTKDFPLSYNKLFGVKDKVGKHAAGQLFNAKMEPLNDSLGQPVIAETPDANSLLNIDGKLYLITHYEYDWLYSDGSRSPTRQPMSMTLTQVEQNTKTGKLKATGQEPINFSSVGGLWIPCFGSQTPWNTHLGSEEDYDLQYNPLNTDPKKGYAKTQSGVEVMKNVYGNAKASPYQYGYLTEVVVGKDGKATPIKHYGLGRGTWEMGKVMPDGKTIYFGDDGTNVAIFMFVAKVSGDLSKGGSLYAAKWSQVSAENGGEGNLTWVKLGESTSNAQIKALADANTFDTIFNNYPVENGQCTTGGMRIRAGSSADECLSIKPGMETAAAFLESRRAAALLGATAEFNKMEGIAVNAKDKHIYMAISYLEKGMLANPEAPTDHVQLPKISAGATFTLEAKSGQKDVSGNPIASDYVATRMYVEPALLGEDISRDALGNTANPNKIANTDNVFFSDRMRTLFIGEDSADRHVNNFVWAYNVDTKKLTRILSLPVGAEATGLQVVEDLNSYAYIMSNSQHHGDWKQATTYSKLVSDALGKIDKFDANVGYIGGLPAMK